MASIIKRVGPALMLTFAVSFTCSGAAAEAPGFSAVCEDKSGRAFRSDKFGKSELSSEWSDKETWPEKPFLHITYVKGDAAAKDVRTGRAMPVVARGQAELILVDVGSTGTAVSAWSYAVNLKTQQIIASQVNAFNAFGSGIKGRVVELECHFTL